MDRNIDWLLWSVTTGILVGPYSASSVCFALFFFFLSYIVWVFSQKTSRSNCILLIVYALFLPILIVFLCAYDLFLLTFSLEALSLSLYFLIYLAGNMKQKPLEVVFKYYFIGSVATFLLLMGISYLYGHVGATSFFLLKKAFLLIYLTIGRLPHRTLIYSILSIMSSFLLKLAAFPFNWWVADVFQGKSYRMILLDNTVVKIMYFSALLKLTNHLFFGIYEVKVLLYISCLGSIIYGTLAAMNQLNIKRFMAFTGVTNVGWLLIGLCCGTTEGLASTLLFLVVYILMNFIFWFLLIRLEVLGRPVLYFSDLTLLALKSPLDATGLLAVITAMAGFPPLGGFFVKYCLLAAAINAGLYFLAITVLSCSAVTGFLYLKLLKAIFFDIPWGRCDHSHFNFLKMNNTGQLILLLFLYFLIFLGFLVGKLFFWFIILSFYISSPYF